MIIHPAELKKLIEKELAFIKGRRIYIKCSRCGEFVWINKLIFGSLHVCV